MNQEQIEAAVLRRLLSHLDGRKDVQNIDLMNLAGFCRNCLSKWYAEAAGEQGVTLDKEAARYQTETTPEQAAQFAAQQADSAGE